MSLKEALASLVNGKKAEDLYKFISESQFSKAACTELGEVLNSLTTAELIILWDNLEIICESTVLRLFGDNASEDDKVKGSRVLCNIAIIAQKTTVPGLHAVPGGLLQTALVLSGLLLEDLPPKCSKLKPKIVLLNETWWQLKLQGYEALGGNAILFFLRKLFAEPLVKADIKRIWNLREAMHFVKLDNRTGSELKKYLKMCAVSPEFLEVELGPKFLSYSLLLSEDIIEEIHLAIKNTLTTWTQKLAKAYAEIYYKAWGSASEHLRQKIEFLCIQDMMQLAMLVDRSTGVFTVVKIFLHYIHMQRADGKTEMLVRLYEPILWRHLKVPNADVRANAAAIFFSAFPLEVKREMDNADLLQKQYGVMQDLLMDNNPCVRAIAVTGICDACTDYWELIPPSTIQSLLRRCVDDMIMDVSSCDVRASVSVGFAHLLDNPLAHPYLQTILPKLAVSFHDNSEQVRVAVLELLLKSKHMKPFQYWDVVPLEDLLARLKSDVKPVKKRIMKLILNSFFPENAPSMFLLKRCTQLIAMERHVSLSFYRQLCDFVDVKQIVDFIRFICRYLKRLLKHRKEKSENSDSFQGLNQAVNEDEDNSDEGKTTDEETRKQNDELFENPERIGGLIDVISILWSKLLKRKMVVVGDESYQKVTFAMCGLLPFLVSVYKDTVAWHSILYFSSYISPRLGSGHILHKYCLSRLRGLPPTAKVKDYNTYLSCLFQWDYDDEVMEILSGWLNAALNIKSKSKQQPSARRVRICDPCEVQPDLACDILTWLLTDPFCRTKLYSTQVHLHSCWNQLQAVLKVIERRIKEGRVPNPVLTTDEFLLSAFSLYCRIAVHITNVPDHTPFSVYEALFKWAENELLPCLQRSSDSLSNTSTRASIRLAQRTHVIFAKSLLQIIFKVCGDMIIIGIANLAFCTQLKNLTKATLLAASDLNLASAACKFVFSLLSFMKTHDVEKTDTYKGLIGELFDSVVRSIAEVFSTSTESLPERFKDLKLLVTQVLISCNEQSQDATEVASQITSIGCAIIANMNDMIEKECGYTEIDDLTDLPLLTRFLLSVVFTKPSLVSLLLDHLHYVVSSGLIKEPSKILAVVAILHIIGHKFAQVEAKVLKASMLVVAQVVHDSLGLCPVDSNDSSLAIDRDYVLTSDHLLAELNDKFVEK